MLASSMVIFIFRAYTDRRAALVWLQPGTPPTAPAQGTLFEMLQSWVHPALET